MADQEIPIDPWVARLQDDVDILRIGCDKLAQAIRGSTERFDGEIQFLGEADHQHQNGVEFEDRSSRTTDDPDQWNPRSNRGSHVRSTTKR